MLAECNFCGAPLDINGTNPVVKCRYCGKTSQARALRTVAPQTPPGWKPPPRWTPPAHLNPTGTQLRYHNPNAARVVLILSLVSTVVAGMAGVLAFRLTSPISAGLTSGSSASGRLSRAQLLTLTMRESPEQLSRITGVKPGANHQMYVPLSDDRFESITFTWDPKQPEHVQAVSLRMTNAKEHQAIVGKRLTEIFGARFTPPMVSWEGSSLHYMPESRLLNFKADLSEMIFGQNLFWREQVETLWAVVKVAALDQKGPVDPQAMRDYLGAGYPLRAMTSLDLQTDVDRSAAAVKAIYRGAVPKLHIDLEYSIALDHPLFGSATIGWENKKASLVQEVRLWPRPGQQKFGNQAQLVACMTALLGKPSQVSEGDHLRGGNQDFTWRPKGGGEVRIYEHLISISLRSVFTAPMPRDQFQRVIPAFDACGRSAR